MIRRTACLVSRSQDAWRNQAIEKHLMDTLPEDTAVLFLWQDACAVLLGRGQSAAEACAPEQLARRKGQLARRLSGGGGLYIGRRTGRVRRDNRVGTERRNCARGRPLIKKPQRRIRAARGLEWTDL